MRRLKKIRSYLRIYSFRNVSPSQIAYSLNMSWPQVKEDCERLVELGFATKAKNGWYKATSKHWRDSHRG